MHVPCARDDCRLTQGSATVHRDERGRATVRDASHHLLTVLRCITVAQLCDSSAQCNARTHVSAPNTLQIRACMLAVTHQSHMHTSRCAHQPPAMSCQKTGRGRCTVRSNSVSKTSPKPRTLSQTLARGARCSGRQHARAVVTAGRLAAAVYVHHLRPATQPAQLRHLLTQTPHPDQHRKMQHACLPQHPAAPQRHTRRSRVLLQRAQRC